MKSQKHNIFGKLLCFLTWYTWFRNGSELLTTTLTLVHHTTKTKFPNSWFVSVLSLHVYSDALYPSVLSVPKGLHFMINYLKLEVQKHKSIATDVQHYNSALWSRGESSGVDKGNVCISRCASKWTLY